MGTTRRRVAVIGCGRGELVIALAITSPSAVIAGFDSDPTAVAAARALAARLGVSDRVTFEVASSGVILGRGYDVVYLVGGDEHPGPVRSGPARSGPPPGPAAAPPPRRPRPAG